MRGQRSPVPEQNGTDVWERYSEAWGPDLDDDEDVLDDEDEWDDEEWERAA